MKLSFALALAVVAAALTGCKKNDTAAMQNDPLAAPAYDESALGGPVDAGFTAPEPQPIQPAPMPIASRSYTVQPKDTLWSIAVREYGNGQRWKDIAAANGITDPAKLPVGQTIVLP